MLKNVIKIGVALAVAVNSCILTMPMTSATTLENCIFEMQTNYKTVYAGETFSLNLVNMTGNEVTWTSSDTDVATVSDGVVTAVSNGTAVITATSESNSKKCYLTVNAENTGVSIVEPYVTGAPNKTVQLTLETTNGIAPSDVTWTSSNTGCATVDDSGLVKIVGSGANVYGTITASAVKDGVTYSDKCAVYATSNGRYIMYSIITDASMNASDQLLQEKYYDNDSGTYKNYTALTSTSMWSGKWYLNGSDDHGYISYASMVARTKGEAAWAFKAPSDGTVKVTMNAGKANKPLAQASGFAYADVGIYLNDTQKYFCDVSKLVDKYPETISNAAGNPSGFDVAVNAGDYVYVRAMMPKDEIETTQAALCQSNTEGFQFAFERTDEDNSITAPQSLAAAPGETVSLNAEASKSGSTITYMSSDESVAEVDESGNVTIKSDVAIGSSCDIYSVAELNGNTYAGTITKINVNTDKLVLNKTYARVAKGERFTLSGTILADTPYSTDITLSSADNSIASVSGNTVTANAVGTTYVTAEASNKKAVCAVEVYDPRLYFEENYFELPNAGDSAVLDLKGTLSDGTVTYTKYCSQYANNLAFNEETKECTFGGNGYVGLVEIVASATDTDTNETVRATATFVVGGSGYDTDSTNQVTAAELGEYAAADHYLWKYGYAAYGSTDYSLMPAASGMYLKSAATGDYWTTGSFELSATGASKWNPGRAGASKRKDVVLVFRAPKTGRIKISTNATPKIDGDNMPFKIVYNGEAIYSYTFSGNGTTDNTFKSNLGEKYLDVQKGEEILFTLSYGDDNSYWNCDRLTMNSGMFKINYESVLTVTEDNASLITGETMSVSGKAVSDNTAVAVFENGSIKAVGAGDASIFVYDENDILTNVINLTVNDITAVLSENGTKINIKVKPLEGGTVYTAVYDGTRFKSVNVQQTDNSNVMSFDVPIGEGNVRVYFWDNYMRPLCNAIVIR